MPKLPEGEFIDKAAQLWAELKRDDFRSYEARTSRKADEKRLWAITLSSDWAGNGLQKMQRLLTLLARAIETAVRSPLFNSRTTLWTVCRTAEGLEHLAAGVVPGDGGGRGWERGIYDDQVLRVKLPEDTLAYLYAEAKN